MVTVSGTKKGGRTPQAKISWLAPLPIWARPGPAGLRAQDNFLAGYPAILRFDHDDFMAEYLSTLQNEPERLGEWLARPETWRQPMASPAKPASASKPATPATRAAFLFEKTRQQTAARKPAATMTIDPSASARKAAVAAHGETDEQLPLKLYQAGQKRHYLVTASLVREEAGLPDCGPDMGRSEKASFVVRRLLPPADTTEAPVGGWGGWDEYAFMGEGKKNVWRRIGNRNSAAARSLIAGEEQLPLFPVPFKGGCAAHRRLLSGVIPVSRREAWVGAGIGADAGNAGDDGQNPAASSSAGTMSLPALLFQADVASAWKLLLERAEFKKNSGARTFDNFTADQTAQDRDRRRLVLTSRDEIQTASWYVLLDFAKFLRDHLPAVWQVLAGEKTDASLTIQEQALVSVLRATVLPWPLAAAILTFPGLTPFPWPAPFTGTIASISADTRYSGGHLAWNLADALVRALAAETGLEAVDTIFTRYNEVPNHLTVDGDWPDFLFPLADPELDFPLPAVASQALSGLSGLERQQGAVDELTRMVTALLPAGPAAEELIDTVPVGDDSRAAWFVLRCVYERPLCGPLFAPLVSAPTRAFQMAPFFDPDAPARAVRIPMPMDISVAGLRKYQKNTGFVISDMLCGKIKAIRKMTLADLVLSILPWPFHKDLPNPGKSGPCQDGAGGFGMICSLSIPIVTLCALILMMIIVALFDLFFRWIPYLFICLPIPGLKGKGKNGSG
jgi:hypothetical protein